MTPVTASEAATCEVDVTVEQESEMPYKIFRVLDDAQEMHVTSRPNRAGAEKFVAEFSGYWPGKYAIRGPDSSVKFITTAKAASK